VRLLDIVRKEARKRRPPGTLRREVGALGASDGDWQQAEQALAEEMRTSLRRARPLVEALGRVAAAAGGDGPRGRAARLRASFLTHAGRDRAALAPYRRAIALLEGRARDGARLGLAASLLRLGRFAESRRTCAAVRREALLRGDEMLAAAADLNEAVAIDEGGAPGRAVTLYRRAREGLAAAGRRDLAATATQNLANAHLLCDEYIEAGRLYDEAARELDVLGQTREAARCRMNRGELSVVTDRLGEADQALREAERGFRSAGDPLQASLARRFRGEALFRAGLLPEAAHALRTAARGMGGGAAPVQKARTALLRARTEIDAGRPAAATAILRRAPQSALDAASVAEVRGRAAAAEGRAGEAERQFLAAARGHGDARPASRARCLAAAAWSAVESGRPHRAALPAAQAERAAAALGVPGLRFSGAAVAFLAAAALGDRDRADGALARAAAALEDLRTGLGGETMRAALLRGREAWLAQAVRFLLDGPGGADAALAFLETWRARALLDLLDGTAKDGKTTAADRVARLRSRVAALEARAAGRPGPSFVRAPETATRALAGQLRAAERDLLEALAGTDGTREAPAAASRDIAAVRASIPEGTCLVALWADERDGVAFVVGRGGAREVRGLASRPQIESLVRDLRFRFGAMTLGAEFVRRHEKRLARGADEVLARISAAALGPLEDALADAERIVIVPHGAWHHVPFAALPFRGRPLVATHSIALAPAVGAFVRPPAPAVGAPVVLAVEDEAAPDLRREGERVAAVLGATLLRGEAATAEALARLDSPSCLHIASHGRARADAPAASGVRLADGWFRAAEFARLSLRGTVVVLSGCETGVSTVGAGDEIHGLVRGVLASGASDLVASLWRVDDEGTTRLMERFHAARAGGVSPADALAVAQREAAAEGLHPWRWAGFGVHSRVLAADRG